MGSQTNGRLEDYFSSKVESLRKDVECVFGILKGRWASLDKGFKYRDVKTCGQIFLTCVVLHNMMLSETNWCLALLSVLSTSGIWPI